MDTEEIANIPKKQGYVVANEISDRKGMFKKIILAFIFIIVIGLGVGVMVKNIRKHRTGASLRNKHWYLIYYFVFINHYYNRYDILITILQICLEQLISYPKLIHIYFT